MANLNDVNHEISPATKPCSTAPGNKSGIVHAQTNFITKNINTKHTPLIKNKQHDKQDKMISKRTSSLQS